MFQLFLACWEQVWSMLKRSKLIEDMLKHFIRILREVCKHVRHGLGMS